MKPLVKNIALFSPYLTPVGTERVILTLAQGFAEAGHEVKLLRVYKEWQSANNLHPNIRVVDLWGAHIFPWLPRFGFWFRISLALLSLAILPRLVWYLRKDRPDVIVVALLTVLPIIGKFLACVPGQIVVTVQGWPRSTWLRRRVWRWLYRSVNLVVAPTIGVARAVREVSSISDECIHVVANPVLSHDIVEKADEVVRHPWFATGEPPVILGVGRLTRQKGFDLLVNAFAGVRAVREARLLILGDGEDRSRLVQQVQSLGIDQDVCFLGHVDNPYKFMVRADVFVLSSRWEGPGHVLIEALALGTPAVVTDCPVGPREILGEGDSAGILVPMENPLALRDGILKVLENPAHWQDAAERERHRVDRYYDRDVIEAYIRLIGV